jgi:serine/threonine protein kinase
MMRKARVWVLHVTALDAGRLLEDACMLSFMQRCTLVHLAQAAPPCCWAHCCCCTPVPLPTSLTPCLCLPCLRSFQQEMRILGRLRHPNVVALLGGCLTPPNICIVEELMQTSLAAYIATR